MHLDRHVSKNRIFRSHIYLTYTDIKPHPSQTRGVNKFEATAHPWMPSVLEAWQNVMDCVDLSKPARPQNEIWGYWIPEPGLLLRPRNPDRLHRYIMNWLRLRPAWLYLLRLRDARVSSIPTQWWQDFLYGDTGRATSTDTFNAKRMSQMREVFHLAFQDSDYAPSNTSPVPWFDHRLSTLDPTLCPMIIWEVCELGFRHEMLALDRLLVPSRQSSFTEEEREELLSQVFPGKTLHTVPELPSEGFGLSANVPRRRVPYLEAFRQIMARWPRAPPSFYDQHNPITTAMADDLILRREEELVCFYVQTFFEQSGRAPIVPHRVPL